MKRAWPESTTGRLALLFAAVAIFTFTSVGSYLYYSLARELERHDDLELIGKVALVRNLLEQTPSSSAIERDQHFFLDAVVGHDGLVLQLRSADGRTILSNGSPSTSLPQTSIVALQDDPTFSDVEDWTPAQGTGRVVRAMGATASGPGDSVEIVLGLESTERAIVLASYSRTLVLSITAGALLAALLGYLVTRVALRPIRIFSDQANSISAQRLHTRLPMDNVPSEFRALAESFNSMFDRLEDGVQRLSNFAADLAHDLRTPINNLMVQTQVALSKPRSPSEYQALLESDNEEYERLAHMIENTLFLARAENAQLAVRPKNLNVCAELGRIGQYFEGLAEEARVSLRVECQPLEIHADATLLQRAVSNLVSNAIQHTPHDGVVVLSARNAVGAIEIMVSNTGTPIPDHLRDQIFDRYYRGDEARSAQTGSIGLGLSIVRAIMRLHGGSARVECGQDERIAFVLSFPAPS